MNTVAIISAGALAISIVTLVLTQLQRLNDTRRIVRQQLTDCLVRIADLSLQWKKSPEEGEWLEPAISAEARLAGTLIRQLPQSLVTDTDYAALAAAIQDDDFIEAKRYYEKAIEISSSDYYRSGYRTGYAAHLFLVRGDYAAGRKQYTEALKSFSDSTDDCHARRAYLYSSWASLEAEVENHEEAVKLQQQAADEVSEIQNTALRKLYTQYQPMKDADRNGRSSSTYPKLYLPNSG